jgi:hypothetical protein
MTRPHSFDEQLRFSHDLADAPWWEEVYRRAFPDFVGMHDLRQDGWHQRAGRDRAVVLSSGKTLYVDEKGRKKLYPRSDGNGLANDILVEMWSQYPRGTGPPYPPVRGSKPGWAAEPKDTDWLAYAVVPTRRCHLIPMLGLRAAWIAKGRVWQRLAEAKRDEFRYVVAPNANYDTISIAVPTDILYLAIRNAMTVEWSQDGEQGDPPVAVDATPPESWVLRDPDDPWSDVVVRRPPDWKQAA